MAASRGEHASCPPGTLLGNRYKVVRECGCGNFSKVFECVDTKDDNKLVAVKLLKKEYASDAAFEREILAALGSKEQRADVKVSRMVDYFVHNRHPTFVFPLLGPSLRSCKLGVTRGNLSGEEMRAFTVQMLETMKFLHEEARLVHTDLKPENILLDRQLEKDQKGIGHGWTICDFGSASFLRKDRLDCDLISTRPYRAPEVVLGNGWHTAADIWSLGCVLFEVQAGSRLFEVHDDFEHLHAFENRLKKLPVALTKTSKNSSKFFLSDGSHRRPTVKSARPMAEVLKDSPDFLDLLQHMLDFDPANRITATDALHHPFITGGLRRPSPPPLPAAAELDVEPLPKRYMPSPAAAPTSARPLRERSGSLENAAGKPPLPKTASSNRMEKRYVGAGGAVEAAREMAKLRAGKITSHQIPAAGKPSYYAKYLA